MRKNLRDARKKKGLTQQQLAEQIGISYTFYRYLESGAQNGSVRYWDRMEDLLGVPQRTLREDFLADPKPKKERCPTCGQTIRQKKDQTGKVSQADPVQSER